MIELVSKKPDLTITGDILKGDTGGHYTPNVDEEGNLTWTPSEEGMAAVEPTNIKGPIGEIGPEGKSGVWTEETTPPDGYNVWICQSGEAEPALTFQQMEEYVDDAIAAIDLPDPTVAASGVTFDDTAAGIGAANVQEAIEYLADSGITSEVVQEQIEENLATFNRYIHLYGLLTDDINITGMNNNTASADSIDELFYKLQTTGSCSYASISKSIYIPYLNAIQRNYIGFNKITKVLALNDGGEVRDGTNGIGSVYYVKAIMLPGILVFFTGHTAGSDGEGAGYNITTNRLKRVREYLGLPNLLTVQEQLNNIGNIIDGNEVSY